MDRNLLLPPWNVRLISENFYPRLTWQPSPNISDSIQYEVERRNSNQTFPKWIKKASCKGNNKNETQSCQLHLPQLFSIYHARVRARDGSMLSKWTRSNELQPYKHTVIGPLVLSLATAEDTLSVSISLPPTPLKKKDFSMIFSLLQVLLTLRGEDGDTQRVYFPKRAKEPTMSLENTFDNMKPNANYCVEAEVVSHSAKKATQCILTPGSSPSNYWSIFVVAVVALFGVIMLSLIGIAFLKSYLYTGSKGVDIPKSLIFLHKFPVSRSVFHLEDGPSISLFVVDWPHNHSSPTEQKNCQKDFTPGSCRAQSVSLYCNNGFVQGNRSNKDVIFSFFPLEDSCSITGLVRDEEPRDKSCRTAPEHLESSDIQMLRFNPSACDTHGTLQHLSRSYH
ncbi:interferon lambda receptor 1-like isoform X2 [Ahaetulla prasina]|uniref:interferon lambda receptor 1-like isoform X2 n=1 Tax=Ahaetulla prasina TaxID=499056 RepID=UPI002648CDDD|nr:interferon lambda receptor 1-like isoform X2 [Ahaetulla prasina]